MGADLVKFDFDMMLIWLQAITVYYGGELAKDIAERIVKEGSQKGFAMLLSDMDNVKKADYTKSSTAVFIIQARRSLFDMMMARQAATANITC